MLKLPVIERGLPREHTEQCRLSGAVAADQPEALADLNSELRFIKERMLAEGDMRVEECDQGHGRIVRIGRAMRKVDERRSLPEAERVKHLVTQGRTVAM